MGFWGTDVQATGIRGLSDQCIVRGWLSAHCTISMRNFQKEIEFEAGQEYGFKTTDEKIKGPFKNLLELVNNNDDEDYVIGEAEQKKTGEISMLLEDDIKNKLDVLKGLKDLGL